MILCYNCLPPHLEQYFAYYSLRPMDHENEVNKLVLLWMAENFVEQTDSTKSMKEVGSGYFSELLSRSFFRKLHNESRFVM